MSKPISFVAFLEPHVEVLAVPLDQIVLDPDQPRGAFEPESIMTLAQSMSQQGLIQPVILCPRRADGMYELILGDHPGRDAHRPPLHTGRGKPCAEKPQPAGDPRSHRDPPCRG